MHALPATNTPINAREEEQPYDMSPSSPLNDSAIRHRNPHSHQPSTALNIGGGGEDTLNGNTSSGNGSNKIHRHYHRRVSTGNSTKMYMVLGGGLAVFFICVMGLWSSSYTPDMKDHKDIDLSNNYRHKENSEGEFIPHRNSHNRHATNEDVSMQGRKYEKTHGHDDRRNDRNRFHDLPILRNKKNIIKDDDEYDEETLALSKNDKPRAIHVLFDPMREQADSEEEAETNKAETNRYRHKYSNAFRITKVKPLSKTPYDRDMFSPSERDVSPYPDDDYYVQNIQKIKKLSKKYAHALRDSADEECRFKYEWQEGSFPNCNVLHEFELGQLNDMLGRMKRNRLRLREGDGNDLVQYLSNGYWRDVWVLSHRLPPDETRSKEKEELTVLKTLRYEHDFTDRNYDRHRKDALASERMSGSPYVVDIFAYCQNTAIFEYGEGGDIDGKLWPYDEEQEEHVIAELSSWEKLDIAYQVACGIADLHDVEEDHVASIAHTDITPSQFIFIDGKWKLNDFNRCRFMREHTKDKSVCGFEVGSNPGKFRAPEEYAYEIETEKIDVYSMGNVFYTILSGMMPFEDVKTNKATKQVMAGKRPKMPSEVKESDDIAIKAILAATKKCWRQDPEERARASEIRDELKSVMERIKKENVTKFAET